MAGVVKVYLDTSIVSVLASFFEGLRTEKLPTDLNVARQRVTTFTWWSNREQNQQYEYFSDLTRHEADQGNRISSGHRLRLLENRAGRELFEDGPSRRLADEFVAQGAILASDMMDARHAAIATTRRMDYVLTWNLGDFTAHPQKLVDVARQCGHPAPIFCTPDRLVHGMERGHELDFNSKRVLSHSN